MDKKLILSIERIEYKSKNDKESNSLENLKNNIQLLPKVLKFFQSIKIENLKINDNEFYIWFNGSDLYLDNKFINLSSKIDDSSNTIFFEINSLYLKDYKVLFDGKAKVDYFSKELNFFGNLYFENFQTRLNIDITSEKIKFYLESKYFENLKFLKDYLDLPKEANEWMYENVTGDFKLDWLYGEYDLKKNELIEKSIEGKAHIKDAKIRFHKAVDEIFTKSVDISFKDDNLHFDLIKPKFKDKSLEGSFVTIHNLTDDINGNVEVNIKTNSKLDEDILGILKAYKINLPIKQKSGITNANLVLDFPYSLDKQMSTKGEFLVENSQIFIDNFSFFSKKAEVILDENMVYVKDASFLYEDMIDANVNLSIDTNSLKSTGTAFINSLIVKKDDSEKIVEIRDKNSSIDMNFNSHTTINLKDLDTKIKVDKSIFIDIVNLSKIYNYSKLLQTYAIKDGNISLEIKDKKEINFSAFLKNIDLPIQKDEKLIKDFHINGLIKDENIEISALDDDIKLIVNGETKLYLKDLKIFVDTKTNTNNLKQNLDLYLKNCKLDLDNETYKIKDASIAIKDESIDFDATIKDLDIPLKKDGENLEEIELLGNYKKDDIKIYTKNEDLILFLEKDSLSLYIEGYDVSYSTENENSLTYKKIDIIGKNSNIVINKEFKIISDNYELRIRPNNKFAYLKYRDTQVVFRDTNGKIELYAADIGANFLDKILNRGIFLDGKVHFFAIGNIDNLQGKVILKDSSIANLSILNNLLLVIQTSPALINPLLAIPSVVGFATNSGNLMTYKVSNGDLEFNYSKTRGLIDIVKLNTVGNGIDFEGKGKIDLINSNLDFNLNVIFFKDYANIVGAIPVLNYILLGDENRVETKVNIFGDLNNPTISTNLTKDTINIPTNIIKRVINSPARLFNNINNLENEENSSLIMNKSE